jgi:large subunit ribosomal protein L6
MSRIGRQPIVVPPGVNVEVQPRHITVTGSKGTLELDLLPGIKVEQIEGELIVKRLMATPVTQRTYGLTRTLLANMVTGVSQGYSKQLEINGVGYRASVGGATLNLSLGFSHPVAFNLPKGIEVKVEKNVITVSGHDKQLVGQVAANIRALKKPEPYKGKGIKYVTERIRRKAGKTATKG